MPGTDDTHAPQREVSTNPCLKVGEVLAQRYEVIRPLGEGGMGVVVEVLDRDLDEPIALKLLHHKLSSDPEYRQRLRQEVRLARRVSHPNVCRVHDLGQHGEQLFVTMELLRGPTLRAVMQAIASGATPALTLGRKIDLVVQLAAALAAAHQVGIVHRDVKPDNIIVEEHRVVLADFGVATPFTAGTLRDAVVGTPDYIAPEVLRGHRAEPAADIYACAIVTYELLAGRRPFTYAGLTQALESARRTAPAVPPLPEGIAPALARAALESVLANALAQEPARRPHSVQRLAEAIALAARGAREVVFTPPPIRIQAPEQSDVSLDATVHPEPTVARVVTALAFHAARKGPAFADLPQHTVEETGELESLERAVTRLGGTLVTSTPSELLALFGAPRALGDDVVRATRAAHALLGSLASGRIGLHTGRVAVDFGVGGVRARGDAIDRARELAVEAGDGEVLASSVTARHLLGRFATIEGARHHRVLPVLHGEAASFELSPLCGRAGEVARLEQLVLEAFEQRVARVALVFGPAGAGKSRLRIEVERRLAERREAEWLVARANPLGGGVPLGILQNASREWFVAVQAAAAGGRAAAFAAARRWLEARASIRPVVLALDDLHWADDASREFLTSLRRDLDQVPVAILLFSRSGPDAPDLALDVDLSLPLAPIEVAAGRAIAQHLAPGVGAEAIDEMVRRAGGNPFFLEELARHAAESPHVPDELPASVELAILARLDQLPRAARRVACAAAVVGRELDRSALEATLVIEPMTSDAIDRALAELERRQIVTATGASSSDTLGGERYAFHHVLIRDVAYAQLVDGNRRRAHEALADHLETRIARVRRDPALRLALAQHRDAAGDRAAARDAYRASGELALELAAYREAHQALSRAEQLADDVVDGSLLELCGDALLQFDSAAASSRFERALALATTPLDQARLLFKLGTVANNRADNPSAIECFERGLTLLGPPAALDVADRATKLVAGRLLAMLGWVIGYEIGDYRRGLPHAERAVALLERTGDLLELASGLSRLAANYMRAGRWHDRLRCNLRHLEIADTLGDIDRRLAAHINLGVNYHSLGRIDTALAHTRRGLELSIRSGRGTTRALAHNNLGLILCDAGEDLRARDELEEARSCAERVGYTRFLPEMLSTLAILDLRAGELASAETHARRAVDLACESASPLNEGISRRILAGVLARGGRLADARTQLAQSHVTIGDDEYERARTHALESKLAAIAGEVELSRTLRDRARRVFESLGAQLDLSRLDDVHDVR